MYLVSIPPESCLWLQFINLCSLVLVLAFVNKALYLSLHLYDAM